MTIKALRDLLFASRVDYKEQYKRAVEERKAKLKEATDNFKENSPFLRSRKEQIQKEFDSRIAELRNAEIASIVPAFDALRKAELKRVTEIDTAAMNRINAVANIPMTAEEIKALGGQYNPGTNYWVNRAIAAIAEKNGVSPAEIGVEPSLDTKLEILKGLEAQFDMMIQSWNPESKTSNAKFDAALGDATLEDAVSRYTNGATEKKKGRQTLQIALARILTETSESARAVLIQNTMRNMTPENREALMYQLVTADGRNKVSEFAWQMAGLETEYNEWNGGKARDYASAQQAIADIKRMKDRQVIDLKIKEYAGNEFFGRFLEAEAKENPNIREAIGGASAEVAE